MSDTADPTASGDSVVQVHLDEPATKRPAAEIPVTVTVNGCLVSFNGTPTLWLNEPMPLDAVLAEATTQRVAEMYRRGHVHHSR